METQDCLEKVPKLTAGIFQPSSTSQKNPIHDLLPNTLEIWSSKIFPENFGRVHTNDTTVFSQDSLVYNSTNSPFSHKLYKENENYSKQKILATY